MFGRSVVTRHQVSTLMELFNRNAIGVRDWKRACLRRVVSGEQVDVCALAQRVITRKPRASPWVTDVANSPALKGQHSLRLFVSPFQGFGFLEIENPGRCPGLSSCDPSGQTAKLNLSPNKRLMNDCREISPLFIKTGLPITANSAHCSTSQPINEEHHGTPAFRRASISLASLSA